MNDSHNFEPVPPVSNAPAAADEDRPLTLRLRTLATIISGALALGFGYSSITAKQNEQAVKIDALRDEVRALAARFETLRGFGRGENFPARE